jgi:hypothetical protein
MVINMFILLGFERGTRKSNVLFSTKKKMVKQDKCQLTCPHGIKFHFKYFCTRNFVIWGVSKLQNVNNNFFHSTQMKFKMYLRWFYNSIKLYLISSSCLCINEVFFTKIMFMSVSCKYWQGISKSWKFDINRCVVEDNCRIVNYVVDVVGTFKSPMSCQLIFLDHLLILYSRY